MFCFLLVVPFEDYWKVENSLCFLFFYKKWLINCSFPVIMNLGRSIKGKCFQQLTVPLVKCMIIRSQLSANELFLSISQRRSCRALLPALMSLIQRELLSLLTNLNVFLLAVTMIQKGMICINFCRYICHLTLGGFALTFPLDGVEMNASGIELTNIGSDQTKINLRATAYR